MAGTDHSKASVGGGPAVVLVRPQLAQNIGAAARAMANFGLAELRLVAPRAPWPDPAAAAASAGAAHVLAAARVFSTLEAAIADLTLVYATTARERGQAKPVDGPTDAAARLRREVGQGATVGVVFGPERTGLENDEVALADRILTFPVNPAFASVNLAQAVLLVGYEWFKAAGAPLPFDMPQRWPLAEKRDLLAFFAHLEGALDDIGFFHPPSRRPVLVRNLRNVFHRVGLSVQDLRTLHGVVDALVAGRRERGVRKERRVLPKVEEE
jgi:tRNA/rRNA methyltransferase